MYVYTWYVCMCVCMYISNLHVLLLHVPRLHLWLHGNFDRVELSSWNIVKGEYIHAPRNQVESTEWVTALDIPAFTSEFNDDKGSPYD